MLPRLRLLGQILRALWRIGLLSFRPSVPLAFLRAWWRCGSSYACLAEVAARRFPERIAVVDDRGGLTFRELRQQAEALSTSLAREPDLRPGDRVGLLARNHRDLLVALIALGRLGVDVLLLGTGIPAPALRRLLAAEAPRLVLHDAEFAALLESTRIPRLVLGRALPACPRPLPRTRQAGRIVLLTSGSTGTAKRIARRPTPGSLLPVVAGLVRALPLRMHAPTLAAIPLYHGYGLALSAMALAFGAPLHLGRRCEIAPLLARLPGDGPPAFLVSIPTLLRRWLRAPDAPCPPLAAVVTGSAPLSPGLCRRLLDRAGPCVFNLYGSTEAGIIALATPSDLREAPGTVGIPLLGNQVRVAPETREIQVRGPMVVTVAKGQWYGTGDLGRLDDHGRLFVCGRLDGMVVSGGENVYPFETEAALLEHPDLADAAVVAVDDPDFGQALLALVAPAPGLALDGNLIRDWLRTRLEPCKLPRNIQVIEAIPRNALGKLDVPALRALVATVRPQDRMPTHEVDRG